MHTHTNTEVRNVSSLGHPFSYGAFCQIHLNHLGCLTWYTVRVSKQQRQSFASNKTRTTDNNMNTHTDTGQFLVKAFVFLLIQRSISYKESSKRNRKQRRSILKETFFPFTLSLTFASFDQDKSDTNPHTYKSVCEQVNRLNIRAFKTCKVEIEE